MARSGKEWIGKNDDAQIPGEVRLRVWNRAKAHCQICGKLMLAGERKELDHIKPLADGGEHREKNLQIACAPCHTKKTGKEATDRARVRKQAKAINGLKVAPKKPIESPGFLTSQHKAKRQARAAEKQLPPRVRDVFGRTVAQEQSR